MRAVSILLFIVMTTLGRQAIAQNHVFPTAVAGSDSPFSNIAWPRPFVYGGIGLNGGGYAPLSEELGAGLRIDRNHLIWSASAAYDNSHKSNDNTINNTKGHERGLDSSIYYRLSDGWFAGGGASWSQLSTTNYTKQDFHPLIGAGKDYFHKECAAEDCIADWSARFQVDYKLKGAEHVDAKGCSVPDGQCTNNLQGPMLTLYLPSPALGGHVYWRETIGIYTFHDTVTSTDPLLTAQQQGHRSVAAFLDFTMMYRF